MSWILQHKLIFIVAIVLVAGGVWFGLSSSAPPAPLLTTDTIKATGSPTEESADQELVGSLLSLRAVSLSGTIFADPAFTGLQDFGTPIVPEPVGRPNPFAPLQGTASAGAGTGGAPAQAPFKRR